jgi:hypothetical protein
MAALAQCTVELTPETYAELVDFLEEAGEANSQAIASFVDKAVQLRIFEKTSQRIQARTADLTEDQIMAIVDEELAQARNHNDRRSR